MEETTFENLTPCKHEAGESERYPSGRRRCALKGADSPGACGWENPETCPLVQKKKK